MYSDIPFRAIDVWLEEADINQVVSDAWNKEVKGGSGLWTSVLRTTVRKPWSGRWKSIRVIKMRRKGRNGRTKLPHIVLGKMAESCGPLLIVKLGVHKALVVSDADIAKECFTTNDRVFATRPKSLAVKLMGYNYAMFGLGPYGDYWRKVRKMIMIEVLSQRRVEMLSYIRVPEVRTSMKDIYEAWVRNKESVDSDKLRVEIKKLFGNFQLNIITRTISGKRFSSADEEGVRVLAVTRKFLELLGTFVVSDFLPYFKWLDLGGYQKEMKKTAKEIDNIFEGWLEEHRKRRRVFGEHQLEGEHDFMNVFLSILEDASKQEFTGFDHDTMIKATSLVS
nr:cytochrome P450 CYP82D47-like [Tanacetum cinerariifolium]